MPGAADALEHRPGPPGRIVHMGTIWWVVEPDDGVTEPADLGGQDRRPQGFDGPLLAGLVPTAGVARDGGLDDVHQHRGIVERDGIDGDVALEQDGGHWSYPSITLSRQGLHLPDPRPSGVGSGLPHLHLRTSPLVDWHGSSGNRTPDPVPASSC